MENPIENWIMEDGVITDILTSIEHSSLNDADAAEKVFYQIGNYLKLPLLPADISEEDYDSNDEPRAVLIELAVINYMYSNEDIKGNVMLALYNIYNKCYTDFEEASAIHFGDESKIPGEHFIYFFGNSVDARLSFSLPKEQTWVEAGAKLIVEVIRHN